MNWKLLWIGGWIGASASSVFADQFHYQNVLVGERAQGMGGAYGAIADDASGVFYNPAGLAFAQSNDISGSANAFYEKKTVYKSVLAGNDYTEKSSGTFAPFFGALQKIEKTIPGLSLGFSYYAIDTGLRDQNDTFENLALSSSTQQKRFHIAASTRNNTFAFAAGAGYRVSSSFAVGLSLGYMRVSELEQIYQDSQFYNASMKRNFLLTQNTRTSLEAEAIEPGLGVQATFGTLSMGFSVKAPQTLTQKYQDTREVRYYTIPDTSGATTDANKGNYEGNDPTKPAIGYICSEVAVNDAGAEAGVAGTGCTIADGKLKKPLGDLPMQARLGFAWFATQKFLVAYDATYTAAVTNASIDFFQRDAVLNHALGMEYYITGSLPLRFGLFTNNAASPKMNPDKYPRGQMDHVDYLGSSLFLAWVQTNSQVALGGVYQTGSGDSRKTGDATIQKVESTAYTLALSATHSF